MGGSVCGLVQPQASPQLDQVRDAPPAPLWRSHGDLPSPVCRLRAGTPKASTPLVTISPVLASTGSGVDQSTTSRNCSRASYVVDSCLNSIRGVIFSGRHRRSGIKFVTPDQRHSGSANAVCKERTEVYEIARRANSTRWSRHTLCWRQPDEVWINKPIEEPNPIFELPLIQAALMAAEE